MSAAGKVTAENINQLTDNNTALGSALKSTVMEMNPVLKQYGSFASASEEGAISVEMLDKAMQKLGKAGGEGVTTIGDAWDSFNETLSLALLPTLDALTPIISGLIDKMGDWGESAGKTITNVIKYFQDLFQKLQENAATLAFLEAWDNIKSAFDSIVSIIGDVINSFLGINTETAKNATSIDNVAKSIAVFAGKFSEVTEKIADFLKKISESKSAMDTLKGTLVVLASAFVALKVINGITKAFETYNKIVKIGTAIQGAFNAVMAINPFVALGIAIAAIVAGLVYFFTQTETGKKAWASFVDFLKRAWDGIVSFFSGIGQWFADIWNGVVDGAKGIWQGLVDWFSGIIQGIKDAWNGVKEFFTGLWDGIVNIVKTVFTTISSLVTNAYNWFITTFQPLISFFKSIFDLIRSVINLAFQIILAIIRGAYKLVLDAWQGLSDWFGGIFDAVKSVVSSVFRAIGSFASSAWEVVSSIWSVVSGFFSRIFNTVKNVVSSVFSALGGFASNAWDAITGVFSSVGSWFGGVFDSVKEAVSNALGALGNIAKGAWDSITSVFGGVYDFFANAFGGVKDLVDNILGGISGALDKITGAINGVSKTVGRLFKGSMVVGLTDINLSSSGYGLSTNSVSSDNRTYNTFNVQGGAGQDVSNLARAIRREFELGRA